MEALYGGAAGGGKSDALLMGALQNIEVPGYAALILRRTLPDLMLPGNLMARSHQWFYGKDCHWDGKNRTWTFPSTATISFGYLEHEADKYRYQGSEFQYVAFDELTQFEETQYSYLFSRLRRTDDVPVLPRMRTGSNPGGIGHEWVKQRFIVEGAAHGRVFVPASLFDNAHINQDEYAAALGQLDPITKMQLMLGDWDVVHGGSIFRRDWFEMVDTWPDELKVVRYWDLAATEPRQGTDPDYTVGVLMGKAPNGIYYVLDVRRMRGTPEAVENLIQQTALEDGKDVAIYIEQEPGSAGVNTIDHYVRRVLDGFNARGHKTTGKKEFRAMRFSAQAGHRNVRVARAHWFGNWIGELEGFPKAMHDDQVDASSGAFEMLQTQSWWQDARCLDWLKARLLPESQQGSEVTMPALASRPSAAEAEETDIARGNAQGIRGIAAPGSSRIFFTPPSDPNRYRQDRKVAV